MKRGQKVSFEIKLITLSLELSEECHQEGKARRLPINSPTCVQKSRETQNPFRCDQKTGLKIINH